MPKLSKAALKDLEQQVSNVGITMEHLPTLEAKKEFIAAQLEGSQRAAYRHMVDLEVARTFAAHKDENYQDLARQRFEESIGSLKALKPTIEVLSRVGKELASEKE